jgi:hypothetical protein
MAEFYGEDEEVVFFQGSVKFEWVSTESSDT